MTEKLDSNSTEPTADYMTQAFTTDDGLIVPPPTREMGPRRLSRYRLDVADFLRALRDGGELPEEPVEYMGALPEGEAGSDTRKIFDRFNALLEEGAFDGDSSAETESGAAEDTTVVTENIKIYSSDDFVENPENSPVIESPAAEPQDEVITSDDLVEAGVISATLESEVDSAEEEIISSDDFVEQASAPVETHAEEEEVLTSDDLVDAAGLPDSDVVPVEAPSDEMPPAVEETTVEEIIAADENDQVETATAEGADESEPHRFSHLFADESNVDGETETVASDAESEIPLVVATSPVEPIEETTSHEVSVADESNVSTATSDELLAPAVAAPVAAEPVVAPAEESKSTPNRFDLIRAKAEKARSVSTSSTGLPEPVSALDSQGIDFEPLNEAEDRRAAESRRLAETQAEPVTETPAVSEPIAETLPTEDHTISQSSEISEPTDEQSMEKSSTFSVAEAVSNKSREPQTKQPLAEVEEEANYQPTPLSEKKRNSTTWIGVMSILAIIILIFVWLMFFK